MADKDARVRLNLAAGGFASMMRELEKQAGKLAEEIEDIGDAGEKADRKLSPLMGTWKRGFGAAKSSLTELGSTLKSTLGQALTLGGALSFGAGVKAAVDIVDVYKNIAFAVEAGTGKAMAWQQVQSSVEGTAGRWKRSNEEVAASLAAIRDETGDIDFATAATEAAAKAATATGKSMQPLSGIAGTLNEKFGIGADAIDETMASVIAMGSKGGASIEDLGEKLGMVGASAKLLGLEGKAGLQQVLGMLNMADDATGSFKKSLAATSQLMETFADPDKLKAIEKELGVKVTDKSGAARKDALEAILAKTGGKQELLAKVFSGDSLKLVSSFGKAFQETFTETEGTVKQKTAAAVDAFRASLTAAGEQTLTAAQLEAQAKKRLDDPARQLEEAMNTFKRSFQKPEMIDAIERMSTLMPKLADGAADLVEFIADNPMLAGAAFVGGKVGGAVGGSVAGDVGKALLDALKPGAKSAGDIIGKAASAHPNWATAGKALGVAAAAYVGYEIGKAIVDSRMEKKEKLQGDVVAAGASAHAAALSGDPKRMAEARDQLKERIRQMKKDQGGVGGAFDTFMGGLATFADPNFVAPEQKQLMTAERDLRKLEEAMSKGAKGGEKAGESFDRAARAADRFAQALDRSSGGGSGNNGLPPAPGNTPGSAPR